MYQKIMSPLDGSELEVAARDRALSILNTFKQQE